MHTAIQMPSGSQRVCNMFQEKLVGNIHRFKKVVPFLETSVLPLDDSDVFVGVMFEFG